MVFSYRLIHLIALQPFYARVLKENNKCMWLIIAGGTLSATLLKIKDSKGTEKWSALSVLHFILINVDMSYLKFSW